MIIFWGVISFLFALGIAGLNFSLRARNINGFKMWFDKLMKKIEN